MLPFLHLGWNLAELHFVYYKENGREYFRLEIELIALTGLSHLVLLDSIWEQLYKAPSPVNTI